MKEDLVRIIPKSKPETPKIVVFLFFFSALILIVFAAAYFFIQNKNSALTTEKKALEDEFVLSGPDKELEKELKAVARKINDFVPILERHRTSSEFFEFLRKSCHPKTRFDKFRLSLKEMKADLVGDTANFRTLAEQLMALKNIEGVKDIKIANVSLSREGKVDFSINFNFPEEFVKK